MHFAWKICCRWKISGFVKMSASPHDCEMGGLILGPTFRATATFDAPEFDVPSCPALQNLSRGLFAGSRQTLMDPTGLSEATSTVRP